MKNNVTSITCLGWLGLGFQFATIEEIVMLSADEYPLVSVVIATYNCSFYITRAVKSALDQTYPNVEVIVIDDGSTDNTPEILQSFRDRIRVVSQDNRGPAAARNAGLAVAEGKYIAILDADDYWLPERLGKMIPVLEEGPHDLLLSNFYTVDENCRRLTASPAYDKLFRPPHKDQYKDILWRSYAFAMTVGKSELFRSQGGYDESLRNEAEDYDFWLRSLRDGAHWGYVNEPLAEYMIRTGSISRTYSANRAKALRYIFGKHAAIIGRWKAFWLYRYHLAGYRGDLLWTAVKKRDAASIIISALLQALLSPMLLVIIPVRLASYLGHLVLR